MGSTTSTPTTEYAGVPPGNVRTAMEAASLHPEEIKGKTYIITGAYSGIGVETTKTLLKYKAKKVIIGGRSQSKIDEFIAQLKEEGYNKDAIDGYVIDLSDLVSVQNFTKYVVKTYKQIDVLINNAGVMMTPAETTKQGYEIQFGTNVIGHYLLNKNLVDITKRQVWVSSEGHHMGNSLKLDLSKVKNSKDYDITTKYDSAWRYQQSKLGNILIAKEFMTRYSNVNLESVSLHPGVIQTNLSRHMNPILISIMKFYLWITGMSIKSIEQGAATTITCTVLPTSKLENGSYYMDCELKEPNINATDMDDAKALFDYCDKETKQYQ